MQELLLREEDLGQALREWLAEAPDAAFSLAVERLEDGRLLLRPLPELDPALLARIRVTIAKYHEALMNLT